MVEHAFERRHTFRDPIHGFIRVSDGEREIIDTMEFQRLRRIKQLGTGHLLYHGAEHSRFGHSLGVMEVATKVFRAIRVRRPGLLETSDDWDRYEQILRLAALLHDVGHAPYSHASEELFPTDSSGQRFEHEDYTRAIVLNSEIGSIINERFSEVAISARDVMNAYSDDPAALGPCGVLLENILAGELDADRMDYLARDSLYAGVSYGRYDLDRLLDTITAVEEEDGPLHLAVEMDGQQALEAFLLARYYMFLQVYLHKHRRFYDLALTETIRKLLGDDGCYPSPTEWQSYVGLDDVWLLAGLESVAAAGSHWAECLRERNHWKVVAEHFTGPLDTELSSRPDPADWTDAINKVIERFPGDIVAFDDAKGKTFQRTGPGPYIAVAADQEESPKILLLDKDGRPFRVEDLSGLVAALGRRRIRIRRLYARPDHADEVLSVYKEELKKIA